MNDKEITDIFKDGSNPLTDLGGFFNKVLILLKEATMNIEKLNSAIENEKQRKQQKQKAIEIANAVVDEALEFSKLSVDGIAPRPKFEGGEYIETERERGIIHTISFHPANNTYVYCINSLNPLGKITGNACILETDITNPKR